MNMNCVSHCGEIYILVSGSEDNHGGLLTIPKAELISKSH